MWKTSALSPPFSPSSRDDLFLFLVCTTAADNTFCCRYMFGPDWLVAPVYEQGAKNRSVYLPAGSKWEHYYSQTLTEGGVRITQETALADFPLYRRWTGA